MTERDVPRLLLRGGHIIDPASGFDGPGDVLMQGGRIAAVGRNLESGGGQTIDVSGRVVAPGFIDMHVHLREPGREDAETIRTGTQAAAAGGFTAVAAMPNTEPPNDDRAVTEFILRKAACHGVVRVHPIGCVTKGRAGRELAEIGDLCAAGCVAVSDDGSPVASALVMRRALEYCRTFGIPVIDHCEDPSLSAAGVMNEGPVSTVLGLRGAPAEAESIMVERDIQLAGLAEGRVHIAHVSTRDSIEAIRRAKNRGMDITAEVTPHHLLLTDECLKSYDSNFRVNPPLRQEADRAACVQALVEGVIDCIATDHAPHPNQEKNVEFDAAPNGVIGLETALPVLLDRLVATGLLPLSRLIQALSMEPARILRLSGQGSLEVGTLADVTVLDLDRPVCLDARAFRSLARNTPFQGWRCKGRAVLTVVGGKVAHDGTGREDADEALPGSREPGSRFSIASKTGRQAPGKRKPPGP
ncbi:MAG: dihydroorotase [Acidobacteriota bacterium]